MAKIVIGIHGLANKPSAQTLAQYWKQSIAEGLENVGGKSPKFEFQMVYWAGFLYKQPLHDDAAYRFDRNYNNEPYLPATRLKPYKDGWKDDLRKIAGQTLGPGMDWFKRTFGVHRLADSILGAKLKDLDYYYDNGPVRAGDGKQRGAREVLRKELADVLAANEGKEIILIAHSMGTIIAYDVLRVLGHTGPKVEVKDFITIGSPLGLPHVKLKIIEERRKEKRPNAAKLRTPTLVTGSWMNFADRRDPVALDSHLRDDYGENERRIRVRDDLVSNDYVNQDGEHNHHKSYGYLRTPELSKHLRACLTS